MQLIILLSIYICFSNFAYSSPFENKILDEVESENSENTSIFEVIEESQNNTKQEQNLDIIESTDTPEPQNTILKEKAFKECNNIDLALVNLSNAYKETFTIRLHEKKSFGKISTLLKKCYIENNKRYNSYGVITLEIEDSLNNFTHSVNIVNNLQLSGFIFGHDVKYMLSIAKLH